MQLVYLHISYTREAETSIYLQRAHNDNIVVVVYVTQYLIVGNARGRVFVRFSRKSGKTDYDETVCICSIYAWEDYTLL